MWAKPVFVRGSIVKRSNGKVVAVRQRLNDNAFRLTPALEKAGYRVPHIVLSQEGYAYKINRRVIDDGTID